MYEVERLSAAKIAEAYGLRTANTKSAETLVLYHLRKQGIKRRDRAEHIRKVTSQMVDEWVRRYKAGESLKEIAGEDVDHVTVWNHLKARGVQLRKKVEAQIKAVSKYERQPFNGDEFEKAYLIGLRLGDFDVVRHGRLIRLRVSTTHPSMANLFESLCSPYGHVSYYPRTAQFSGYEWTLECDLDPSFEFLLKKPRIVKLQRLTPKQFLAFLAGFFDAEGSIYFHRKRNSSFEVSVSNTNFEILSVINSRLAGMGYHPIIEHAVQNPKRFGKPTDGEIWKLCIRRGEEITRLLQRLMFRHEEKRTKARLALDCMTGESALNSGGLPEGWAEYLLKVRQERDAFVRMASEAAETRRRRTE